MKRNMIICYILVIVLVVILFALVMGRTTITFSPFSVHMHYPWNSAAWGSWFVLVYVGQWILPINQNKHPKKSFMNTWRNSRK